MSKFLGRQSLLWCLLFDIWVIWGVCWLLVSPVYAAWESGYTHRKLGTFGTVGGPHTQFPVLINLTDSDVDDNCDDDGKGSWDIMFTTSDGTTDLDIDWIDYSEAAGSATIHCYVSQSGWSINDGTEFYMYYENAAAGDPGTANGVWDSNFIAVWHLHEASGTIYDSADAVTGHDSASADPEAYQNAGMNKYAISFDGVADEILFTDHADFDIQNYTIQFMFKVDVWAQGDTLFSHYDSTTDDGIYFYLQNAASPGEMRTSLWVDNVVVTTATADDVVAEGTFFLFHSTRANYADPGTMQNYLNGAASGNPGVQTGTAETTGPPAMGCKSDQGNRTDGLLEEVRWSNVARDANWIAFEYDNLNEADNEISWDSEESESSYIPKVIIIGGHSGMGLCLVVFRRRKKK